MKPNNKAIEAGFNACTTVSRSIVIDILTAAYAAQFQSEEYAGLVKELRDAVDCHQCDETGEKAADALEALLAERDTLKSKLKTMTENWEEAVKTNSKLCHIHLKERDALLARLAPVNDEALLKATAQAICDYVYVSPDDKFEFQGIARAVIAAIRPHIEAAERERCAKIAEEGEDGSCWTASERAIAAAIRGGSGSVK